MKKTLLVAAALTLAAGAASAASIVDSPHDMSNGTGEICIYCHTPHNADIPIPLWNRKNPSAGSFTLYKTSATLTDATKDSKLSDDSISLFCMSCHDGTIALNAVVNKNNLAEDGNPGDPAVVSRFTGVIPDSKKKLGTNLSNTHPIGFDYVTAQSQDNGLRVPTDVQTAFANGLDGRTQSQSFLYGSQSRTFECASCHRVHDPGTSNNFLRIENEQSALCLACHIK